MDFRDTLKQASHLYTDSSRAATLNTIFHMKQNENEMKILFFLSSFLSLRHFQSALTKNVKNDNTDRRTHRSMPVKL